MKLFSSDDQTENVRESVCLLQRYLGIVSGLSNDLQQIPIRSQATLASVVSDLPTAPLGPAAVISKDDLVMSGQVAQPPGEDSNRVAQQLGIQQIVVGAFHSAGIGANLASPFQSLAVYPLDQEFD